MGKSDTEMTKGNLPETNTLMRRNEWEGHEKVESREEGRGGRGGGCRARCECIDENTLRCLPLVLVSSSDTLFFSISSALLPPPFLPELFMQYLPRPYSLVLFLKRYPFVFLLLLPLQDTFLVSPSSYMNLPPYIFAPPPPPSAPPVSTPGRHFLLIGLAAN